VFWFCRTCQLEWGLKQRHCYGANLKYMDTCLRRSRYLTRPMIWFLSEQRLHFFLFFIKSYNLSRRPCGPDVSASYWTHTTDQNPPLLFCYWWFLRLQCLRRKRLPLVAYCHCNNCLKFICIVLPCQERLSLKS
jgi:hypothetical protein